MNQLKAAKQPVSLCMPLTLRIGPMLEMAVIFSGLASMPRLDTMYSKQLPLWNPKNTFFGIQFDVELSEVHECCSQVHDQVASLSHFDHYVINIDIDYWFWPVDLVRLVERVDLVGKALLHAPLVGGASVLQAERLGYIAVRTIRGDE